MGGEEKYWYNTKTGEVEQGHRSSWTHLMGPYATRAEAERALERARSRNDAWEDEDDAWRREE
ncbi:SPOR domain-containing protein [Myceligenerans salitolerans]|uniref:SPOR domain-containing protein n=1 Tax=Myceligenerans salitolerans TaxID=1230528 RepID=A0ABS3ICY9_9MICO|nr:SPOR domain-containing protein [Myceligenerans salitolerans]MBO0610896.1 SPOR domain-containing protein [Myceligenerans salitolerans]